MRRSSGPGSTPISSTRTLRAASDRRRAPRPAGPRGTARASAGRGGARASGARRRAPRAGRSPPGGARPPARSRSRVRSPRAAAPRAGGSPRPRTARPRRRPAEARARARVRRRCLARPSVLAAARSLGDKALESQRVHDLAIEAQLVSAAAGDDLSPPLSDQHLAQLGDVQLHHLRRGGGRLLAPQPSISRPTDIVLFAFSASSASTARCLGPPSCSGRPSTSTSTGPRRRICMDVGLRAILTPIPAPVNDSCAERRPILYRASSPSLREGRAGGPGSEERTCPPSTTSPRGRRACWPARNGDQARERVNISHRRSRGTCRRCDAGADRHRGSASIGKLRTHDRAVLRGLLRRWLRLEPTGRRGDQHRAVLRGLLRRWLRLEPTGRRGDQHRAVLRGLFRRWLRLEPTGRPRTATGRARRLGQQRVWLGRSGHRGRRRGGPAHHLARHAQRRASPARPCRAPVTDRRNAEGGLAAHGSRPAPRVYRKGSSVRFRWRAFGVPATPGSRAWTPERPVPSPVCNNAGGLCNVWVMANLPKR